MDNLIVTRPFGLIGYTGNLTLSEIIEACVFTYHQNVNEETFLFHLEESIYSLHESKLTDTTYALLWDDFYNFLEEGYRIQSVLQWLYSLHTPYPAQEVLPIDSSSVIIIF